MATRRLGSYLERSTKSFIRRNSVDVSARGTRVSVSPHNLKSDGLQQALSTARILQHYSSSSTFSPSSPSIESIKNCGRTSSPKTRALSGEPEKVAPEVHEEQEGLLNYPGAKTNFIHEIGFIAGTANDPVPCYRLLDEVGQPIPSARLPEVSADLALKMYTNMVTLQTMDVIFYEAQRQGRFSFYLTTRGEEAINIATAAALSPQDVVFTQYREPGILMWRGFTLEDFANQCFGNSGDLGKGRQMPCHYGSRALNYSTVSSPIATQLPQAVGAAYAMKMAGTPACIVALFGDGASSEGDFHAALNFAATLETPIVFICRNNGWAISTPVSDQFRSDGVVVKGRGYGVNSIRVDGNDTLALYSAVKTAREMAMAEGAPVLIEALTYRIGHHSTSDDSSKYRERHEIEHWKVQRDPVVRFKRWMESEGWWNVDLEKKLRASARTEVIPTY